MRPDMDKVLCERPRNGGRWKRKCLYREPLEDRPSFEPVSRRRNGSKYLNEHLGPLRRWLVSQVGRPWDDVYSELRANISPSNAVQMHIWEHAQHYVARWVVIDDGHVYMRREHRRTYRPGPLNPWSCPVYVCPSTGVLRRTPDLPNSRKRQQKQERERIKAEGRARARERKKRGGRTEPRVIVPAQPEDEATRK